MQAPSHNKCRNVRALPRLQKAQGTTSQPRSSQACSGKQHTLQQVLQLTWQGQGKRPYKPVCKSDTLNRKTLHMLVLKCCCCRTVNMLVSSKPHLSSCNANTRTPATTTSNFAHHSRADIQPATPPPPTFVPIPGWAQQAGSHCPAATPKHPCERRPPDQYSIAYTRERIGASLLRHACGLR